MAIKSLSPGLYKAARGQIVVRLLSGTLAGHAFALGDTDLTRNISTEFAERYTNEFATKVLAYREVDQITAELTFTLYQMSLIAQMVGNMSEASQSAQAAAADQQVTLANARGDEVLILPHRRINVASVVVSAGATALDEGTDYTVSTGDGKSFISLLNTAAVQGANIQVDYDGLASAATRYQFGSVTELMAEVTYIENVASKEGREAETHVYHRVGLKVDGDTTLIGSDNGPKTVTVKGTIYPDTTKPEGEQLGYIDTGVNDPAAL